MTQRSRCTDRAASAFSIGNGPLVRVQRSLCSSRSQDVRQHLTSYSGRAQVSSFGPFVVLFGSIASRAGGVMMGELSPM